MAGVSASVSNAELGRRLGVSHSMVSRIRNGRRLPGTWVLYLIHRELGIPLHDLFDAYHAGPEAFGRLVNEYLDPRSIAA